MKEGVPSARLPQRPPGAIDIWVHYMAYIGTEELGQQIMEAGIGVTLTSLGVNHFAVIGNIEKDVVNMIRAGASLLKKPIPAEIPIAVTILGWTKLDTSTIVLTN